MPRAGQGMGGGRHSMSSPGHGHHASSHHVGGGRPMGGGPRGGGPHMGFGPGPGGFGPRDLHGPRGPVGPRMPMGPREPFGGPGCPPPPPPHHHRFHRPPMGFVWHQRYMERRHFEDMLCLLRAMSHGYCLTYDERHYMESIMNFVPHDPYQMDNMIMWIEDELRYF